MDALRADSATALLPDDYRAPVFGLIAKTGGASAYNDLIEVFRGAEDDVLRNHFN